MRRCRREFHRSWSAEAAQHTTGGEAIEEDLACRLGLAQLRGDSPALCQFLLLVHHMGATSDAKPTHMVCHKNHTAKGGGDTAGGDTMHTLLMLPVPDNISCIRDHVSWQPKKHTWPPESQAWGSSALPLPTTMPSHNPVNPCPSARVKGPP